MAERLSDRELDARCAEARGWRYWSHPMDNRASPFRLLLSPADFEHAQTDHDECGGCVFYTEGRGPHQFVPLYSTDLNATRELEDEIERRDLRNDYLNTLIEITGGKEDGVSWRMTHASARQRAEAFCKVMEGQNGR